MKTYINKNYDLPICKFRGKVYDVKYPCYISLKLDGEFTYLVKQGDKVYTINKSEYGRYREDFNALNEFKQLKDIPNGIYLAELYFGEGRTKKDFNNFLRNKTNDNLNLAIWGILELEGKRGLTTEDIFKVLEEIKIKTKDKDFKNFSVIPFWKVKNKIQLQNLIQEWILDNGFEGLVIRNLIAIWRNGQSNNFIKVKTKAREIGYKNINGNEIKFRFEKGIWI